MLLAAVACFSHAVIQAATAANGKALPFPHALGKEAINSLHICYRLDSVMVVGRIQCRVKARLLDWVVTVVYVKRRFVAKMDSP